MICDVVSCRERAVTIMYWPTGRKIRICVEHTGYYKSIAGPHMTFESMEAGK